MFILQCQYASDQGFSPPHSPQMGTGGWMARTWGDKTWEEIIKEVFEVVHCLNLLAALGWQSLN